jgi:hypothetical protein
LLFVAGWYSRRRTSESLVCESAWSKADKRKLLILLATVVQDDLWRFPRRPTWRHLEGYRVGLLIFTALAVMGIIFTALLRNREKGPHGHGLETITTKNPAIT